MNCLESANKLIDDGQPPKSESAQNLAKELWENVQKYSNGKDKTVMKLYDFYRKGAQWPDEFGQIQKQSQTFMEKAMKIYLIKSKLRFGILYSEGLCE